jgi:ferredoxin
MNIKVVKSPVSILEQLENNGVVVDSQCRNGFCGACRCKLVSGEIDYINEPLAWVNEGEILLCCASPKTDVEIDINS